jgi:hypothetical protein
MAPPGVAAGAAPPGIAGLTGADATGSDDESPPPHPDRTAINKPTGTQHSIRMIGHSVLGNRSGMGKDIPFESFKIRHPCQAFEARNRPDRFSFAGNGVFNPNLFYAKTCRGACFSSCLRTGILRGLQRELTRQTR